MKIDEYLQLLFEGKMCEAKAVRFSTIPDRLVKFIWLDGSESDHKKFLSLGRNEIWFAQKDYLNDPYEYKGMLLDRNKLLNAGYSNDIIDYYQQLFDFSDYGITCLSANSIDYLPMWAYYTNNHNEKTKRMYREFFTQILWRYEHGRKKRKSHDSYRSGRDQRNT